MKITNMTTDIVAMTIFKDTLRGEEAIRTIKSLFGYELLEDPAPINVGSLTIEVDDDIDEVEVKTNMRRDIIIHVPNRKKFFKVSLIKALENDIILGLNMLWIY